MSALSRASGLPVGKLSRVESFRLRFVANSKGFGFRVWGRVRFSDSSFLIDSCLRLRSVKGSFKHEVTLVCGGCKDVHALQRLALPCPKLVPAPKPKLRLLHT